MNKYNFYFLLNCISEPVESILFIFPFFFFLGKYRMYLFLLLDHNWLLYNTTWKVSKHWWPKHQIFSLVFRAPLKLLFRNSWRKRMFFHRQLDGPLCRQWRECVKGESAAAAAVAAAPACLPPQHGVARSLCQRCPTSIALQRLREKRLTHDGLCLIYPPEVSSNAPAAPLLLFCSRQRGRKNGSALILKDGERLPG